MADWFNKITEELHAGPPAGSTIPSGGPSDATHTGASRTTAFLAGLAPDIQGKINIFAKRRGVSPERYGVDNEGRIFYIDPDTGRQAYEVPSVSGGSNWFDKFFRSGVVVAHGAPAVIPQVAGGAAAAAIPNPVVGIPAAGAIAGGVETGREMLANQIQGKRLMDLDPLNIAAQAAGGSLFELGGRALSGAASRAYDRNPARLGQLDVATVTADPARIDQARRVSQFAQNNDSFATMGEAANLPGQLQNERFWRQTPEGANFGLRVAERAEKDVPRIAGRTIDTLAPGGTTPGADAAVTNLRNAARDTIKHFEDYRANAASPLYEKAFSANPSMMSPEISRILDTPGGRQALTETANLFQNQRGLIGIPDKELGALARELADLGMMEKPSGGVASGLKMAALDKIKQTLWSMGERATIGGDKQLGAAYKKLAYDLKAEMDRLDVTRKVGPIAERPGGGFYSQARKIYGDESSAVTEAERLLKRFAGDKTSPVARDMDTFFSRTNLTAEETTRAKLLFDAAGKGDAWNDGVSAWLADRLSDSLNTGNAAKDFSKKMWGDDRQRKIIVAALGNDPSKLSALEGLFGWLRAVGRQLPEGSSTGAAMERAKAEAGMPWLSNITRLFSPQEIGGRVAGAIDRATISERRKKFIEIALDPANSRALQNLRLLGPRWKLGIQIVAKIAEQAGLVVGRQQFPASPQQPALTAP